jgi:uncharacterized protein
VTGADAVRAAASRAHPCQRCGACCAAFRVAFYWAEAQPADPDGVPEHLVAPVRPNILAMRGTDAPAPHCVALDGVVGTAVSCRIYAARPSPCRDLQASYEHGAHSAQCDSARAKYALPPLRPQDWQRDVGAA